MTESLVFSSVVPSTQKKLDLFVRSSEELRNPAHNLKQEELRLSKVKGLAQDL